MPIASKMLNQDEQVILFRKHSIYNLYARSRCGKYIHTKRKVIKIGAKHRGGYMLCTIKAEGENKKQLLCSQIHMGVL